MAAHPTSRQRTVITAAIAVAIVAVIASYEIWHTYTAAVENARRDIAQLVQTFQASSDATLQSLELIVDQAAAEVRDQDAGHPGTLTDRFISVAADWPMVYSVIYVEPDGMVRTAVTRGSDGNLHPAVTPRDFSNREFFRYHRDTAVQGVFLTDPIPGNSFRGMAIGMTKKVRRPDGSFGGVCGVTIRIESLAGMFAGLLPAHYDSAGLFKRDGMLLVDQPLTADIGRIFKTPLFTRRIAAATHAVYRLRSQSDGKDRLMAFSVSPRYPIVVTVAALWGEALASWTSASMILGASAAAGIMLIVALTWWQLIRIRNEQAAGDALREREWSLAESQRLAGIGHFERDLNSSSYSWSENMYAMHGVTVTGFAPNKLSLFDLVAAEDRAQLADCWRRMMEDPAPGALEVRIIRPDGRVRNIRYGWQVLDNRWGRPARLFGIAQDLTAMRDAEATIRDDEQRLKDIVECSGDYIWECDADSRVSMITGGATSPIGFLDHWQHADVDDHGDSATLRTAIHSRAKFRNLVVPAADAEGHLRWVRVSANPHFDAQGAFAGYRGAATDVTELRRQQERDEDRRKGEAIGRLAGGLAHEINNLLQPILIYATVGAGEHGRADGRPYFDRIARAAEQASLIVKNVLASARKSPPVRESVNVREAIRETADLLGGTLSGGIVLTVACDRDDLFARVDRTGLTQVLTNLVTNAAEALSEGPGGVRQGRIVVSAGAADLAGDAARSLGLSAGAYCRLAVTDNGPGIPREHRDKVFEPFFTTKPQGKGTGLGLSVVLGLARSWRGTVTLDAPPEPSGEVVRQDGPRTCFAVYLPLEDRQLQAAQ